MVKSSASVRFLVNEVQLLKEYIAPQRMQSRLTFDLH